MALSYLTQLNVKDIAYNLHDQRIGVGASGGMVLQSNAYLGSEASNNKIVAQKDIPTYSYATSTSTATAGMVPSITSAISEPEKKFLRADGVFAQPTAQAAQIEPADTANIGGLKLGYVNSSTTSAISIALQLDGANRAFTPIPVFSTANASPYGFMSAGLVPGLTSTSISTNFKKYHLTGNGWRTYTVSGTTLILDGE